MQNPHQAPDCVFRAFRLVLVTVMIAVTTLPVAAQPKYTVADIGGLGGAGVLDQTIGFAINNTGQIVGQGRIATGEYRAFRTLPNSPINPSTDNLGTLGGDSWANGINNAGHVVGQSYSTTAGGVHAFLWNGSMTDLGHLGGNLSGATAINDLGQITGWSAAAGGGSRPFRTAPYSPINPATDDLGTFGGETNGIAIK